MITQAYFEDIQHQIAKELYKAKKSIYIAVAWFTDDVLFKILIERIKENIAVSVLILNDEINKNYSYINFEELKKLGGEIHLIGSKEEMMHNKFCVIDQETVITGSYNWTRKAQSNDENITITYGSKSLATDFLLEFQRLQKKYLGDCIKIRLEIGSILKRLELLKTSISLQDEEDIEYQNNKLQKEFEAKEIPEDLKIIKDISLYILSKQYSEAAKIISFLIERYKSLVIWIDPEISGLKLEIRSLEIQISSLEDEKAELEKIVFQFEIRYNQELGNLLLEYLELKKAVAEKLKNENPKDEKAQKEFEELKTEYEDFKNNINSARDINVLKLDDAQLQDLKTKFRKITKLTHPDLVDVKFQKEATELFIRAKEAKDRNDLKAMNDILDYLENGVAFPLKHTSLIEKEMLKSEAKRLRHILKKLIEEINTIKQSEQFIKIRAIKNISDYLNEIRLKLIEEIDLMKKQLK